MAQRYDEPELFDYKEMLPDSRDKNGQRRLLKACCAFANSSGGFLVFGITDDKSKSPADRLVGINSAKKFTVEFGEYPRKCNPSVRWEFLNPPPALANGNHIYVIHIPRSWNAPHCVEDSERAGWLSFPKRTNKGDEDMSYEEIRMSFLQYYEKRLKLQLLKGELENIQYLAKSKPSLIPEEGGIVPILGEFRLTVIETVLADTYTILASDQQLVRLLGEILHKCGEMNNQIRYVIANAAFMRADNQTRQHNNWVQMRCNQIERDCDQALNLLAPVLTA